MSRIARRAERGRAERRDEVRDRLLAALESQLEGGASLAAVKVDELAADAEISRATFYIHFQDKVDLMEDWLLQTRWLAFEALNAWYGSPAPRERGQLREVLRVVFEFYRDRMTLMGAMHELALYDATLRAEFAETIEVHFTALAEHITTAQRDGLIDDELRPRETAEWLVCLMDRFPMQVDPQATEEEFARHVDAATDVIWATLYAG